MHGSINQHSKKVVSGVNKVNGIVSEKKESKVELTNKADKDKKRDASCSSFKNG